MTAADSAIKSIIDRLDFNSYKAIIKGLTQFGDQIGGIWAANDGMGLAAIEALRADGRAGQVPVTGIDGIQLAVEAILKGEMAGTVAWDPYWQGGMGLSIGCHAKTGGFDPAAEPREHREFYGTGVIITAENARRYKPAPEVYRTAVGLLGLSPGQVMMVAAHNYDLRAAQAQGLRTAFVPRPTEYGPGQTTDLAPEGNWDVVARDFLDLAEKLGA